MPGVRPCSLPAPGRATPLLRGAQGGMMASPNWFSAPVRFWGGAGPVRRAGTPPRAGLVCAALLIVFCRSQLNYTRPGLPKLNPRLLENWKNEVKEKGHINCPNNVRTTSVLLRVGGSRLWEESGVWGAETHQSQALEA